MANAFATPTWVVNETAYQFSNALHGPANFNRTYDDSFTQAGAKVGATVLARLPQRWTVRRGQAFAAQAINDRTMPITLSYQTGVDFNYSSIEATLELDRVRERYIAPAANTLASDVDAQSMSDVYASVYHAVGTPGTTPATNLLYLQATQKIFDMAGPEDNLTAVLDKLAEITLVNANAATFNPAQTISQQWKSGKFADGALGIREWFRDQNIPRHTTGTFTASTPLVDGALQTGSTININGWASGATSLKKGDVFTIAGVYSVNPISRVSTGRLQQFVITANTSDSSGATATLPISPSIITSGPLQTVSNSPADDAVVTVWAANPAGGTLATTVSPQSLVFHKNFAAFVMADLEDPVAGAKANFARSKDWGISIRLVQQYDIKDDQNGTRLDCIHGTGIIEPAFAVRVVG
jgi:coat protein Gp5